MDLDPTFLSCRAIGWSLDKLLWLDFFGISPYHTLHLRSSNTLIFVPIYGSLRCKDMYSGDASFPFKKGHLLRNMPSAALGRRCGSAAYPSDIGSYWYWYMIGEIGRPD
jgi:hypothetical protein